MRSLRFLLLTLTLLALAGCQRCGDSGPAPAQIRTPLYVEGGQGLIWAEARGDQFDLVRGDHMGTPVGRLAREVEGRALHHRALNPDGHTLAALLGPRGEQVLTLVDTRTGATEVILEGEPVAPDSLAWDLSGSWLAFTLPEAEEIALVNSADMTLRRYPAAAPRVMGWIQRDEPALLMATDFAEGEQPNALALWTPGSGLTPLTLFTAEQGGRIQEAAGHPEGNLVAVTVRGDARDHDALYLLNIEEQSAVRIWDSPRPLSGLQWTRGGQGLHLSQLGRLENDFWTLNRMRLSDWRLEPVGEHMAGATVSPDGQWVTLATGRGNGLERIAHPID